MKTIWRVVTSGTPELVLVSGYSGIGKSSVVHELHKVLVPRAVSSRPESSISTSATSRIPRSRKPFRVSSGAFSRRAKST